MECLAIIILIVSCLLYLVSSQSDVLFRLAQKLPFISEDKLGYFNRSVHLGFIPHFMLHFGTLFIYIVFGPHRYSKQSLYFDVKYMRLYTLCYVINLYALLCFPMIIYNLTFFRLFNGLYLFNYIFYAVTLEKYKKRGGYKTMLAWILFVNGLYILPWVHASGQRTAILNSIVKK